MTNDDGHCDTKYILLCVRILFLKIFSFTERNPTPESTYLPHPPHPIPSPFQLFRASTASREAGWVGSGGEGTGERERASLGSQPATAKTSQVDDMSGLDTYVPPPLCLSARLPESRYLSTWSRSHY